MIKDILDPLHYYLSAITLYSKCDNKTQPEIREHWPNTTWVPKLLQPMDTILTKPKTITQEFGPTIHSVHPTSIQLYTYS